MAEDENSKRTSIFLWVALAVLLIITTINLILLITVHQHVSGCMNIKQDNFADGLLKVTRQLNAVTLAVTFQPNMTVLTTGKIIYFPPIPNQITFEEAKKKCDEFGMHLVTTKTQKELNEYHEAAKNFKSPNTTGWWVSASSIEEGFGNFKWQDNTSLPLNSLLWRTGVAEYVDEPNDYKNHLDSKVCVYLYTDTKAALLDGPCFKRCWVACEL